MSWVPNEALINQVVSLFERSISNPQNVHQEFEVLRQNSEFPFACAWIFARCSQVPVKIRQSAGIQLKNALDGQNTALDEFVKLIILDMIPSEQSDLRLTAASISARLVVTSTLPPNFMNIISKFLNTDALAPIHGSLLVLDMILFDIGEEIWYSYENVFTQEIWPRLLRICDALNENEMKILSIKVINKILDLMVIPVYDQPERAMLLQPLFNVLGVLALNPTPALRAEVCASFRNLAACVEYAAETLASNADALRHVLRFMLINLRDTSSYEVQTNASSFWQTIADMSEKDRSGVDWPHIALKSVVNPPEGVDIVTSAVDNAYVTLPIVLYENLIYTQTDFDHMSKKHFKDLTPEEEAAEFQHEQEDDDDDDDEFNQHEMDGLGRHYKSGWSSETTLRKSCASLLEKLTCMFSDVVAQQLVSRIEDGLSLPTQSLTSNNNNNGMPSADHIYSLEGAFTHNWKLKEAAILAVSILAVGRARVIIDNPIPLTQAVSTILHSTRIPTVRSICLWTLSILLDSSYKRVQNRIYLQNTEGQEAVLSHLGPAGPLDIQAARIEYVTGMADVILNVIVNSGSSFVHEAAAAAIARIVSAATMELLPLLPRIADVFAGLLTRSRFMVLCVTAESVHSIIKAFGAQIQREACSGMINALLRTWAGLSYDSFEVQYLTDTVEGWVINVPRDQSSIHVGDILQRCIELSAAYMEAMLKSSNKDNDFTLPSTASSFTVSSAFNLMATLIVKQGADVAASLYMSPQFVNVLKLGCSFPNFGNEINDRAFSLLSKLLSTNTPVWIGSLKDLLPCIINKLPKCRNAAVVLQDVSLMTLSRNDPAEAAGFLQLIGDANMQLLADTYASVIMQPGSKIALVNTLSYLCVVQSAILAGVANNHVLLAVFDRIARDVFANLCRVLPKFRATVVKCLGELLSRRQCQLSSMGLKALKDLFEKYVKDNNNLFASKDAVGLAEVIISYESLLDDEAVLRAAYGTIQTFNAIQQMGQ